MSKRRERGATLEEIEVLYRTRLPQFRRVAAGIVGDRELARDAVQDAFAVAVRRRETFRRDGSLEGWLWRIVVNTARSAGRGRPRVSAAGDVEATDAAGEADERVRRRAVGILTAS
jgi:RNA polymerase sigma-70 factor (ECF subfamily)